jgi:DNA-directed RNA polymerase specialized sigma24 family protein
MHKQSQHQHADDEMHPSTTAHRLSLDDDEIRDIYRFTYQHVGNREDAECLTERIYTQTAEAARALPEPDEQSMNELLWQTAKAVVAQHLRWFYRSPATSDEAQLTDALTDELIVEGHEQNDAPAQVRDILAHLPRQERDYLVLRFLNNVSLADTANALRMTLSEAQALQWYALVSAARVVSRGHYRPR